MEFSCSNSGFSSSMTARWRIPSLSSSFSSIVAQSLCFALFSHNFALRYVLIDISEYGDNICVILLVSRVESAVDVYCLLLQIAWDGVYGVWYGYAGAGAGAHVNAGYRNAGAGVGAHGNAGL
jgi:hypothetical protein